MKQECFLDMKTVKILGLSLLQTLIYVSLIYVSIRYHAHNLGSDSAAAIGIIGGADGPTAVFVASKFDLSSFFHFSVAGMLIAFIIANVSSLLSNRIISIVILILSYMFTAVSIYVSLIGMLWLPVMMLIVLAGLMLGGYFLSKKL